MRIRLRTSHLECVACAAPPCRRPAEFPSWSLVTTPYASRASSRGGPRQRSWWARSDKQGDARGLRPQGLACERSANHRCAGPDQALATSVLTACRPGVATSQPALLLGRQAPPALQRPADSASQQHHAAGQLHSVCPDRRLATGLARGEVQVDHDPAAGAWPRPGAVDCYAAARWITARAPLKPVRLVQREDPCMPVDPRLRADKFREIATGRSTVKMQPCPGRLRVRTSPPIALTAFRVRESRSPRPDR